MRPTYLVRRTTDQDANTEDEYQTLSLPDVPEDVVEGFEIEIELKALGWAGDWKVVRKWGRVTPKGWFQFLLIEPVDGESDA